MPATSRIGNPKSYRNLDRRAIMDKARECVEAEVERSTVFDAEAVEALSKFSVDEVGLGRVVGRGGFCVVRECASIRLSSSSSPSPVSGTAATSSAADDELGGGGGTGDRGDGTANTEPGTVTPNSSSHRRGRGQATPVVQHAASFPSHDHPSSLSASSNSAALRTALADGLAHLASSNHETSTFPPSHPDLLRQRHRKNPSEGLESFSSVAGGPADTREQLARRVWAKRGNHRYVVKKVEPELFHEDRLTYLKGVIDLALETHYLASLAPQHPHILRIRGVAATGPYQPGYFIVLDRLHDVLSKRLTAWMHRHRSTKGLTGAFTGGRRKVKDLLIERLLVATDVASAMEFLHSRNVIYRDLKPDNVGFDAEGSVKIFDFGLARELSEDERDEDGLYHMTGVTGGIRYMAPEVGLSEPYNLKADVYSWSMLMWYIMALEPPFGLFTPKMFLDRVFKRGYRPVVKDKWPDGINRLMRMCWSATIEERPDFSRVKDLLRKELLLIDPQTSSFISEEFE